MKDIIYADDYSIREVRKVTYGLKEGNEADTNYAQDLLDKFDL